LASGSFEGNVARGRILREDCFDIACHVQNGCAECTLFIKGDRKKINGKRKGGKEERKKINGKRKGGEEERKKISGKRKGGEEERENGQRNERN
jgi:hypothetical protein